MYAFLIFFSNEIVLSSLPISFIAVSSQLIAFSCNWSVFMLLWLLSVNSWSVSSVDDMFINSFDVKIDTNEVMTPTAAMMEPTTTSLAFLFRVRMVWWIFLDFVIFFRLLTSIISCILIEIWLHIWWMSLADTSTWNAWISLMLHGDTLIHGFVKCICFPFWHSLCRLLWLLYIDLQFLWTSHWCLFLF